MGFVGSARGQIVCRMTFPSTTNSVALIARLSPDPSVYHSSDVEEAIDLLILLPTRYGTQTDVVSTPGVTDVLVIFRRRDFDVLIVGPRVHR
jgi:hypothetical protein